jgi:xylulokinase
VGGHVDGLLGVLGSGVRQPGDGVINCGTSGTYSVVATPALGYPIFDLHIAGSATNTAGAALDWFSANLAAPDQSHADLLAGAALVPAGTNGLLFLPHLAGERGALADAYARGAWVGLTLAHDRRHLVRALLEGVAFSFRAMQDWLEDSGARIGQVRSVGGQAHSDVWNQIAADVLGRSLLVPDVVEAVAVGAAMLAALGVGAYADLTEAVRAMVHTNRRFDPDPDRSARYSSLYTTHRALYAALRETNSRLREV